jgi:hypothetical protein
MMASAARRVSLLVIGTRPYEAREVGEALGVATLGTLETDARGAALLLSGAPRRLLRRTPLMRSARLVVENLRSIVTNPIPAGTA